MLTGVSLANSWLKSAVNRRRARKILYDELQGVWLSSNPGVVMFSPTELIADELGRNLADNYRQYFGERRPEFASYLGGAAHLVLETDRQFKRCIS